jgi:hypothetical protein
MTWHHVAKVPVCPDPLAPLANNGPCLRTVQTPSMPVLSVSPAWRVVFPEKRLDMEVWFNSMQAKLHVVWNGEAASDLVFGVCTCEN